MNVYKSQNIKNNYL